MELGEVLGRRRGFVSGRQERWHCRVEREPRFPRPGVFFRPSCLSPGLIGFITAL